MTSRMKQQNLSQEFDENESDNYYDEYDKNDEYDNNDQYNENEEYGEFNDDDEGEGNEPFRYRSSTSPFPIPTKNIPQTFQSSVISYNQELILLRKKFTNQKFNKEINYCLKKKNLLISINENQSKINTLNINKKNIIDIINIITNRMKIRKDEIKAADSNKNMLVLDKTNEKTKNKKIIELNNLIGRIQTSLESSNIELNSKQKEVSEINTNIDDIFKMNEMTNKKIKKMTILFPKEMKKFQKQLDIDYYEFAKSRGWTILTIRNNYAKNSDDEIVEDDKDDEDDNPVDTAPQIEVTSNLTSIFGAISISSPTSNFKIDKMKEPIRPTLPEPVKREIVPVVVKSNFGMKPCNYGNICISKNCKFLHASGHTHEVGRRNKETLEREENNRFQNECQEYNACWDKYEAEMREWNAVQKLHSTDEFPALGGGARK
jgi:hypothetical protein